MRRIESVPLQNGIRMELLELLDERIHILLLSAGQSGTLPRRLHNASDCSLLLGVARPSLGVCRANRADPFLDLRIGDLQLGMSRRKAQDLFPHWRFSGGLILYCPMRTEKNQD